MTLTYGSLFSGCGGMDMGFERAGFHPAWHAEIDRDAVSVLRRHWRDVPQLGSVTDIHGGQIEPVDVLQGGSPCQDVSQAGTRAGLDGARSGLFFDFVRIVGEMREATQGRYPAVVVLENVDGLLSSNRGRDFAVVLGRLQELGAAVAYRVLDAQFFGVPQRRRRVFVVADFAPVGVGEERAAQVLALGESLCGHPEAGDEARQGSAGAAQDGAGVGGNVFSESGHGWWNDGYGCLRAEGENRPSRPSHVVLEPLAYQCQGSNVGPMGTVRSGNGHVTGGVPFLAEPLAVSENQRAEVLLTPYVRSMSNGGGKPGQGYPCVIEPFGATGDIAPALLCRYGKGTDSDVTDTLVISAEVASTIQAAAGHHGHSSPRGDGSDNLVALAFNWQAGGSENDASFRGKSRQYVARAGDYAGAIGVTRQGAVAVAWQESQSGTRIDDVFATLNYDSADRHAGVFERYGLKWIVRRLTPKEGERLQGYPNDWTRWRHDGQQISDSARWRLIGNGVATPVAAWIAKRLRAAMEAS